MRVETNINDRKLLANAIAEWIHEPVHYDGPPRFTYSVGPVTVERDGAITSDDADAWATLMPFFENSGWLDQAQAQLQEHLEALPAAETEAGMESDFEAEPESGITGTRVNIPMGDATPANLVNLLRCLYARQNLINAMTQSDKLFIDEELITLLNDIKPDARGKICEILGGEIRTNMVRGVSFADDRISIEFPYCEEDPVRWQTYANLFFAIVRRAFEAHHISAALLKPEETEMKYFCNCFLMQLGYGGPDNRAARQVLMGHLKGFAAFRTVDKMNAHKARLAQQRHAAKSEEADSDESDR